MQRAQHLAGGIGIAFEARQLGPAAVFALLGKEGAGCLLDCFRAGLCPVESTVSSGFASSNQVRARASRAAISLLRPLGA
jgi:hypothetical protein